MILGPSDSDRHVLLGRLSEIGPKKDVRLDVGKEHVIAVLGKRGSGKTHTLGVLVEALALADGIGTLRTGPVDRAVLVFDTLNLFQWMGFPLSSALGPVARLQLEKARSWGLPDVTLTPRLWHLAGTDVRASQATPFRVCVGDMSPQDWGLLMDVDTVTEPMGQLITAAWDKVARRGWRKGRNRSVGNEGHSIGDLVDCITEDRELATDFTVDTRRAVKQRLNSYQRTGLFSVEGTVLGDVLKPGQVSVFLLANISEDLRTLVVFLLIRRILEQRAAASEETKYSLITGEGDNEPSVPKTWIILDEAQNIIPDRTASIANRELTRFVREGRNFGLSMGISTQQPTAIDARVMAQVDVLVAHTLTVKQDTNYILSNLKSAEPDSIQVSGRSVQLAEALRELAVGQCLVSAVDASRSYFVEMRPRLTPHGGFEA